MGEEKEECKHKWEPIEEAAYSSHIKLKCMKCGRIKEIYLFP